MKFIHLKDLQNVSHYISAVSIIRLEEYDKISIIFTQDGQGIKPAMSIQEIFNLINKES